MLAHLFDGIEIIDTFIECLAQFVNYKQPANGENHIEIHVNVGQILRKCDFCKYWEKKISSKILFQIFKYEKARKEKRRKKLQILEPSSK